MSHISQESSTCFGVFFDKVKCPQNGNFIEKRLAKFAKFLIAPRCKAPFSKLRKGYILKRNL